jgi:hypothetical protein
MKLSKQIFSDKFDELINEGYGEEEAADKAGEYTEDYMAGYGDYLYEREKDRRLSDD